MIGVAVRSTTARETPADEGQTEGDRKPGHEQLGGILLLLEQEDVPTVGENQEERG